MVIEAYKLNRELENRSVPLEQRTCVCDSTKKPCFAIETSEKWTSFTDLVSVVELCDFLRY